MVSVECGGRRAAPCVATYSHHFLRLLRSMLGNDGWLEDCSARRQMSTRSGSRMVDGFGRMDN